MVFRMFWHQRALAAGALLAAVVVPLASSPAMGSTNHRGEGTASRRVAYRGYTFLIPRSWPVIDLAGHPGTCVRFDQHALYLGTPGINQACPSGLVGVTEAVLVQPASGQRATQSVEDPVAHGVTVTAPRIRVTATYQAGRPQILAILVSAGLPPPVAQNLASMAPGQLDAGPIVPASLTDSTGRGFDACTAPSAQAMQAWLAHSQYRAIGIYIGGSDRACAQPNLTAAWVSQQAAAGWHFFPLYVGPQVGFSGEVTAPVSQAVSSAQDAAVQARLLGFGPGSPIYYDMEAYSPNRTHAALRFFSAWTTELHALGYKSGIYSSSGSGISDLVNNYHNPTFVMPDVIDDAWWNGVADTSDPNVPAGDWASHQRIHQFSGNVTQRHGGYTINIDQDYLDVQLGTGTGGGGGGGGGGGARRGTPTRQVSQAVATSHGAVDAFFAGTDGALWSTSYRPGAGWAAPRRLGGSLTSQPSTVVTGGTVRVFYRGANGGLQEVSRSAGGWSQPRVLRMGRLGGGPVAVSGGNGDIQVFWRGANPTQLWNAHFVPGLGWRGPVHLAGGLASDPSPAVSGADTISVFWKGIDGQLWQVSRGPGRSWHSATILAMGQRAGGPEATGQRDGAISVLWGGTARGSIWQTGFTPSGGWVPQSLVATGSRGALFLVAFSRDSAAAFWKGRRSRLWLAIGHGSSGWGSAAPLLMGRIGGDLFAASKGNGTMDVFWKGSASPHLWHARYHPGSASWTGPDDLGGSVG